MIRWFVIWTTLLSLSRDSHYDIIGYATEDHFKENEMTNWYETKDWQQEEDVAEQHDHDKEESTEEQRDANNHS